MANIKDFIADNNIKQVDLARFLGINEASVSKMVNGLTRPSKANLQKMMDNDRGWDTSSLVRSEGKPIRTEEATRLREENKLLRARVEELKQEKERLWAMLENLVTSSSLETLSIKDKQL